MLNLPDFLVETPLLLVVVVVLVVPAPAELLLPVMPGPTLLSAARATGANINNAVSDAISTFCIIFCLRAEVASQCPPRRSALRTVPKVE